MKIALSHPTGNQFVRHALTALYDEGALSRFYTTIGWSDESVITKIAPPNLRKKLSRRSYPVPAKYIRNAPIREFFRLAKPFGVTTSVDKVYFHLDRWVAGHLPRLKAQGEVTGVFAYEDGALNTFKVAHDLGLDRVYELPIGYWKAAQKMYVEETALQPEWISTLSGLNDSPAKLERKDEELARADAVICASSFTKSTLELYDGHEKIPHVVVIPYGAPPPIKFSEVRTGRGPRLRLIFVGGLSQRKGLSYLFDAIAALGSAVELTVIGKPVFDGPAPKVLENHLKNCRYIPSLPHGDILREMRQHDLFVFPSLFEGFALVLLEAMSQGLPCITTPNTAGPDIIDHGKDGFIVPIRDTAQIVACVEKVLADPALLIALKEAALAKAAELNWELYRTRLFKLVRSTCH
jgi:glycosyltransferase involved in cell wall biosynthesis